MSALGSAGVEPPLGSGWGPRATLSKCSGTVSRRAFWSRWPFLLGGMVRLNERGMFEEPRWIAVCIRFCEREGRCRDCQDRQGDERGFHDRYTQRYVTQCGSQFDCARGGFPAPLVLSPSVSRDGGDGLAATGGTSAVAFAIMTDQ